MCLIMGNSGFISSIVVSLFHSVRSLSLYPYGSDDGAFSSIDRHGFHDLLLV